MKHTEGNRHYHYDMIVAKAENMDLVVFVRVSSGWKPQQCNGDQLKFSCGIDYYLCHPKHEEACLHWLNGGEVQSRFVGEEGWLNLSKLSEVEWVTASVFMSDNLEIRIKPKKEKRWIIARSYSLASTIYYKTEDQAQDVIKELSNPPYHDKIDCQVIEIEVEV